MSSMIQNTDPHVILSVISSEVHQGKCIQFIYAHPKKSLKNRTCINLETKYEAHFQQVCRMWHQPVLY